MIATRHDGRGWFAFRERDDARASARRRSPRAHKLRTSLGFERRPRVLVLVTEDWFAVSHFRPILSALVDLGLDVTVATRCSGKQSLLEELGARVIDFDFRRGSFRPVVDAGVTGRLHRLIRHVCPDVVHAISMKPIVLGALAAAAGTGARLIVHMTGVGLAGIEGAAASSILHGAALRLIALKLRRADVRLLVENPDDRALFGRPGDGVFERIVLLGGAGLDPMTFEASPPDTGPLRLAYVGRMVWTKGVDVLVEAHRLARARGVAATLTLCGIPDPDNPRPLSRAELIAWAGRPGVTWQGFVDDIAGVWRAAHVAVVPSRGGEGLPKALLEAAACGRPAIVSDVPGCRHFVRDGVEGLIVPPGDAPALADAIVRLSADSASWQRMGTASRTRLLEGFTAAHVTRAVQRAYLDVLAV